MEANKTDRVELGMFDYDPDTDTYTGSIYLWDAAAQVKIKRSGKDSDSNPQFPDYDLVSRITKASMGVAWLQTARSGAQFLSLKILALGFNNSRPLRGALVRQRDGRFVLLRSGQDDPEPPEQIEFGSFAPDGEGRFRGQLYVFDAAVPVTMTRLTAPSGASENFPDFEIRSASQAPMGAAWVRHRRDTGEEYFSVVVKAYGFAGGEEIRGALFRRADGHLVLVHKPLDPVAERPPSSSLPAPAPR